MIDAFGILGIILSLTLLIFYAYRGVSVLLLAPLMAILAICFHPQTPLLASYTQIFLPALGKFLHTYFPIFLLGAIFGKLMNDTGAAKKIGDTLAKLLGPRHCILAVVLACAALTYGGVSVFVVAFTIYPIGNELFIKAKIPKKLLPGAITLGAFTFTMTAFPGTPSIHNAIPMPYFGTDIFAAPIHGIIGGLIMLGLGLLWLTKRAEQAQKKAQWSPSTGPTNHDFTENTNTPSFIVAIGPLFIVVFANYLLTKHLIPLWDTSYLNQAQYGSTQLSSVAGIWGLIASLSLSIICILLTMNKQLKNPIKSLNEGSYSSMLPILNTASEVGYGAVIASLSSFHLIKNSVIELCPNSPLIAQALSINVLSAITGSASGGLSIALEALGDTFLSMALNHDISPQLLHRIASMASGGFDSLPHNGAIITLLTICGLTHRQSYLDIFMCASAIPLVATFSIIIFG